MTLEALTGYAREQPDAVRARVLERWVDAFANVPGPFAVRAFREWSDGARLPNPNELREIAAKIEAKARERLELHRPVTPARHFEAPREPRSPSLTAERRAEIVRDALRRSPGSNILRRLLRQIEEGTE